jgi:hypothetical protein
MLLQKGMKMKDEKSKIDFNRLIDHKNTSKHLKILGVIASVALGIYLLGHFFKISAHCVNGYNQLKHSIKNGK